MKPIISPVIHMLNMNQVRDNINTCLSVGVDHVFIINHVTGVPELINCTLKMREEFPDLWIGMNPLGYYHEQALSLDLDINALWIDETITTDGRNFKGLVFGGLAFKYQKQPSDIELACKDAIKFTNVACTSGPGTGKAPSIEKIKTLRHYLGNHPLAIASGVSVDNVHLYAEYVDYLMVASSITDQNEMINKDKLYHLYDEIQ